MYGREDHLDLGGGSNDPTAYNIGRRLASPLGSFIAEAGAGTAPTRRDDEPIRINATIRIDTDSRNVLSVERTAYPRGSATPEKDLALV